MGQCADAVFDLFHGYGCRRAWYVRAALAWSRRVARLLRLSVRNAATLWNLVKQEKMANTSVVVTGDIPAAGSTAAMGSHPMPLSTSNQRYRSLPPPFFILGR